MAYFIGLLTLAIIAFATLSGDVFSPQNSLSLFKARISEFVNPKTDKEIAIDGLSTEVDSMIALFGETLPNILKSPSISDQDKANINKMIEVANKSKTATAEIKKLESQNNGLFKTIVSGVTSLISSKATTNNDNPSATYIPPQCKLVCDEKLE